MVDAQESPTIETGARPERSPAPGTGRALPAAGGPEAVIYAAQKTYLGFGLGPGGVLGVHLAGVAVHHLVVQPAPLDLVRHPRIMLRIIPGDPPYTAGRMVAAGSA